MSVRLRRYPSFTRHDLTKMHFGIFVQLNMKLRQRCNSLFLLPPHSASQRMGVTPLVKQ